MRTTILSLAIALGACAGESDVDIGPGGELLVGTHRASATDSRAVALGDRRLVLDGFAGSVRVIGVAPGEPARLTFERVARGRTDLAAQRDLEQVAIEESGDDATYTFRMNARRRGGAEVNVTATVPGDADLTILLAAGTVRVDSLAGDLEVSLDSGPVRGVALAGRRVRVSATAGGVDVSAAALPPEADWHLSTSAGAVTFTVPADATTDVEAETGTGTVRVEGLVFTERRLDRRGTGTRFSGTLGEGGGRVRLQTEVGGIRLRAARQGR